MLQIPNRARLMALAILCSLSCGGSPAPSSPASPVDSHAAVADSPAPHSHDEMAAKIAQLSGDVAVLTEKVNEMEAAKPVPTPRPDRGRPDPGKTYPVPVAGYPWVGEQNAMVTIVKSYEYACPFCNRARPTLAKLLKQYKGNIKIVYRNFVVHPQSAREPALAACAAHQQKRFDVMDKQLWVAFQERKFDRGYIETLARKAGIKMKAFRRDRDGICVKRIKQDQAEMVAFGVRGTPSFFINGRFLSGAQPIALFKVLIDEELGKARTAIKANPKLTSGNYYRRKILGKGDSKP